MLDVLSEALVALVPFGFLAGLLRSRLAQGAAVSELIARLGDAPGEGPLRAALADALGDPTLALAYWLPESERFVDALGRPVTVSGSGWTEVELHGRRIAAIAHDPALTDEPQLVRAAGAAAALALENQRLAAELRARIEDLRASRARLVEAGDAERRRLERDLHDGAQSRLVALALKLRLAAARRSSPGRRRPRCWRSRAPSCRRRWTSCASWRAGSTRRSSPTAGSSRRCARSPTGRRCRCRCPSAAALPPAVEIGGLLRGRRGADERRQVRGRRGRRRSRCGVADGAVAVEVADDGVGGADVSAGSGLRGLADRVGALDGRIVDRQPGREGARRCAREIPC